MAHSQVKVALTVLVIAACGGTKEASEASCKDVEAAIRRISPERTKKLEAGLFERACKDKPDEYPPKRRGCIVKAQTSADLKACAEGAVDPPPNRASPPASIKVDSVKAVPTFGVGIDAPENATVEERETNAHVGNGRFKLNLFVVDEYASKTGAAESASLQKEPGFVKFTTNKDDGKTWRFDYEIEGGKAGTSSRIIVGDRVLDCGVHGVEPAVAAAVAMACANARPLGGTGVGGIMGSGDSKNTSGRKSSRDSEGDGDTQRGGTSKGGGVASAPTGETDRALVGRHMKTNIAKIRFCYEKELATSPSLTGTVTASFVIGADGAVLSSKATGMGNSSVERCVAATIQRFKFPKPTKAPVAVNYPFTFRPD